MEDFPVDEIPHGAEEMVYPTHMRNMELFYIHIDSHSSILEDIMAALESRYTDLGIQDKLLNCHRLGILCAAKFTDDNLWYRAKITGVLQSGLIEVQFVDYGNTDYVSEDRIKALDPDLAIYPVQSYKCALADVSCKQPFWPPETVLKFEDLVLDKMVKAVFTGKRKSDDAYLVDLYDEMGNKINSLFGAPEDSRCVSEAGDSVKVTLNQNGSGDGHGFKYLSWKVGSKVQATVVYVKDPGSFWCQEMEYVNEIIILSEDLGRMHMTQAMQSLKHVAPGIVCAAKFEEDEAWYRGIVKSVKGDKADVHFVDYGNTETVDVQSLCELKPEMRKLPALAVKCKVAHVGPKGSVYSPAVIEKFETLVMDREFELTIVEKQGASYLVKLLDIEENKDIGTQMQSIIAAAPVVTAAPQSSNSGWAKQKLSASDYDLPLGSSYKVFLSWIDSPANFWVQREDSTNVLDHMSDEIQEFYSQSRAPGSSAPGSFVIARFSDDQLWYRGFVMQEMEDTVSVMFIDYGNSEIISKSDLRMVVAQFGQIRPLAFRCSLAGVKPLRQDNSWSVDAKDFLERLCEEGCECEVLNKTETHVVNLTCNGKDVAQELIALAVVASSKGPTHQASSEVPIFSRSVKLQRGQTEKICITHIDSSQSIWCQLSRNAEQLDALMEKLELHYSEDGGIPVTKPVLGQACIAQFSGDGAWYRAVLTFISSSGYDVHFIDYGNTETLAPTSVCIPEPRFLDLPTQAVQCSLALTENLGNVKDTLSEVLMDKELTLNVLELAGNLAIVDLLDAGVSVADSLQKSGAGSKSQGVMMTPARRVRIGSTVKVYTSVIISPNKFFLQMAGIDEELEGLMGEIALKYVSGSEPSISSPKAGQFCVALYPEDGQWYRAQITETQSSQCSVLFVDYGNEETIDLGNIKEMSSDIATVPILAYQCSLEGTNNETWSESALEAFESLVMDKELKCTFVTASSVRLESECQDVLAELKSAGHVGTRDPPIRNSAPLLPESNQGGWDEDDQQSSPKSLEFGGGSKEREGSGFGGGRRGERGDRFGGKRGQDSVGFGGRFNKDSRDRGVRNQDFGGVRKSDSVGFGGGRERKPSSESTTSSNDNFTYPVPPSEPEKNAILVHMDEDGTFYLQLSSMEKDILYLTKRLAGSYKNGGGPRLKETPVKGTICCGKFNEDGKMYRCLVEEVSGNNALVRFVDFGNMAECGTYDLKFLFPDLLQYPVQAFPCKLRGLDWTLDKAEKFGLATLDKDLEVTFLSSSHPFEVDIKTPDGDLLEIMTGKIEIPAKKPFDFGASSPPAKSGGFGGGLHSSQSFGTSTPKKAEAQKSPKSSPQPSVPAQMYAAQVEDTRSNSAFICHISDDGYFYLQLEKDTNLLETISDKLAALPSLKHPDPCVGAACAAVFSDDSAWYRAQICATEGGKLKVIFVDYGNGDTVSPSNIKPLSSTLLMSPLGYKCQFPNVGPLPSDGQTKLAEYLNDHPVTAVISGSAPIFDVAITTDKGEDLQEIVAPSNDYRPPDVPKEVTPVGVSFIEDDGRIYVQLFNYYKAIEKVQKTLMSRYSCGTAEKLNAPESGSPCCVKSPDADIWYRGKVIQIQEDQAEILAVDFGLKLTVAVGDIYILEAALLKKAPYALECKLKGVDSWTEELRDRFTDMTQDKILNATFFTQNPPFRVALARSIELDLLGLNCPALESSVSSSPDETPETSPRRTVSGENNSYITEVCADGTFYVQSISLEDELNDLAEKLAELSSGEVSNIQAGMTLCAKFTEDDAWYRATVTSCDTDANQFSVQFVDYGNSDTVGSDRLAPLPEGSGLETVAPFACKCSLAGAMSNLTEEQTDQLREMVTDKALTVNFKSEKDGIHQVDVLLDGKNLVDILGLSTGTEGGDSHAITEVCADGTFFVQDISREDELNDLAEKLAELSSGEVSNIQAGMTLCAKFTEDDAWYRATVTSCDTDANQFSVQFVDYGNSDTVGSDRLAPLPEGSGLETVAPFACKCSLAGVMSNLTEERTDQLREMVTDKALTVNFKSEKDGIHQVDVLLDGKNLVDILGLSTEGDEVDNTCEAPSVSKLVSDTTDSIQSEKAGEVLERTQLSVDAQTAPLTTTISLTKKLGCVSSGLEELKQVKVLVSHFDSPSSFWCQLSSSTDILSSLEESLQHTYLMPQEEDRLKAPPSFGDIVVARFSDDQLFYRSRVIRLDENDNGEKKVCVLFVDYGNVGTSCVDEVFHLKDSLFVIPTQAFMCCLDKVQPKDSEEWPEETNNKFSKLIAGEFLLKLVGRKQDGTILVELVREESDSSLSQELVATGLAVVFDSESVKSSLKHEAPANAGEMECLEITQPIMESTVMVGDTTRALQTFSFEESQDGHYRCLKLSLHTEYDVVVSDDELPNAFCVQLVEMRNQYNSLMAEIADHVKSDSCLETSAYVPQVGGPCLLQHSEIWYRGLVCNQSQDGSWLVRCVDNGWEFSLSAGDLMGIPGRFLDLPTQAVSCYLAGIVSVEAEWSSDALTFFADFVRERSLCMYVLENADDGKYGVFLNDADSGVSQSLNRDMVDLHHADVVPGSNIEVQIEMEKTLDTDQLGDLETSFHEVSILRDNAFTVSEGEPAKASKPIEDNSLADTYEENVICKELKSDGTAILPTANKTASEQSEDGVVNLEPVALPQERRFSILSAVEQIDKHGCIDIGPSINLPTIAEITDEFSENDTYCQSESNSLEKKGRGPTLLESCLQIADVRLVRKDVDQISVKGIVGEGADRSAESTTKVEIVVSACKKHAEETQEVSHTVTTASDNGTHRGKSLYSWKKLKEGSEMNKKEMGASCQTLLIADGMRKASEKAEVSSPVLEKSGEVLTDREKRKNNSLKEDTDNDLCGKSMPTEAASSLIIVSGSVVTEKMKEKTTVLEEEEVMTEKEASVRELVLEEINTLSAGSAMKRDDITQANDIDTQETVKIIKETCVGHTEHAIKVTALSHIEDVKEVGVSQVEDVTENGVSQAEEKTGMSQVEEEAGVSQVEEKTGMSQVEEKTGMSQVEEEAGMSQVEEKTGMSQVEEEAGVSQVEEKTGMSQVEEKTGMSQVEEEAGVSQVEEEAGVSQVEEAGMSQVEEARMSQVENVVETGVSQAEDITVTSVSTVEDIEETSASQAENVVETGVSQVENIKEIGVSKIENVKETGVSQVENIKETGVSKIENVKETSVSQVEDSEETGVLQVEDSEDMGVSQVEENKETHVSQIEDIKVTVVSQVENIEENSVLQIEENRETSVSQVEDIKETGMSQVEDIEETGMSQVEDIEETDVSQVEDFKETGVSQVEDIEESNVSEGADITETVSQDEDIFVLSFSETGEIIIESYVPELSERAPEANMPETKASKETILMKKNNFPTDVNAVKRVDHDVKEGIDKDISCLRVSICGEEAVKVGASSAATETMERTDEKTFVKIPVTKSEMITKEKALKVDIPETRTGLEQLETMKLGQSHTKHRESYSNIKVKNDIDTKEKANTYCVEYKIINYSEKREVKDSFSTKEDIVIAEKDDGRNLAEGREGVVIEELVVKRSGQSDVSSKPSAVIQMQSVYSATTGSVSKLSGRIAADTVGDSSTVCHVAQNEVQVLKNTRTNPESSENKCFLKSGQSCKDYRGAVLPFKETINEEVGISCSACQDQNEDLCGLVNYEGEKVQESDPSSFKHKCSSNQESALLDSDHASGHDQQSVQYSSDHDCHGNKGSIPLCSIFTICGDSDSVKLAPDDTCYGQSENDKQSSNHIHSGGSKNVVPLCDHYSCSHLKNNQSSSDHTHCGKVLPITKLPAAQRILAQEMPDVSDDEIYFDANNDSLQLESTPLRASSGPVSEHNDFEDTFVSYVSAAEGDESIQYDRLNGDENECPFYENNTPVTQTTLDECANDIDKAMKCNSSSEENNDADLPTDNRDGLPRDNNDGLPGDNSDGLPGDNSDGLLGDNSDGLPGDNSDGLPGDNSDGLLGDNSDGVSGDDSTGLPGDNSDGVSEENSDGLPRDNSDGVSGDDSAGLPRGNSDGLPRDNSDGVSGDNSDGVSEENSDGLPRDNSDGVSGDNSDGLPGDNSDGVSEENSDGLPRDNSDGVSGDDSAGLPRGNSDGLPRDNSDGVSGDNSDGVSRDDSIGLPRDNSDGVSGDDSAGVPGDNSDGVSGDNSDGVSGDNSDGVSGDDSAGVSGDNSDGVSGDNSDGVSGDNSDGVSGDNSDGVSGDNSDGVSGDNSDGLPGDNSDGLLGDNSDGLSGDNSDSLLGDNSDGLPGDNSDGLFVENSDGVSGDDSTGLPGDNSDGVSEENSDGLPRDNSDGVSGDDSAGLPRGNSDGLPRDNSDGVSGDNSDGVSEENSDGLPRDNSDGVSGDNSDDLPGDNSDGLPGDDSTGLPRDNSDGVSGDNSDGLPGDNSDGLPGDDSIGLPRDNSDGVSGDDSAGVPGDNSDGVSGDNSDGVSGDDSAGLPGDNSDGVSGDNSDGVSGDNSDGVSGDNSDGVSGDNSDGVSGDNSDGLPRDNSDGVSGDNSDGVSGDNSDGLPRDNSDGLPGDNSDGLPGDNSDGLLGDNSDDNDLPGDNCNGQSRDNIAGLPGDNSNCVSGDNTDVLSGDNIDSLSGDSIDGLSGDNSNGRSGDNSDGLTGTDNEDLPGEEEVDSAGAANVSCNLGWEQRELSEDQQCEEHGLTDASSAELMDLKSSEDFHEIKLLSCSEEIEEDSDKQSVIRRSLEGFQLSTGNDEAICVDSSVSYQDENEESCYDTSSLIFTTDESMSKATRVYYTKSYSYTKAVGSSEETSTAESSRGTLLTVDETGTLSELDTSSLSSTRPKAVARSQGKKPPLAKPLGKSILFETDTSSSSSDVTSYLHKFSEKVTPLVSGIFSTSESASSSSSSPNEDSISDLDPNDLSGLDLDAQNQSKSYDADVSLNCDSTSFLSQHVVSLSEGNVEHESLLKKTGSVVHREEGYKNLTEFASDHVEFNNDIEIPDGAQSLESNKCWQDGNKECVESKKTREDTCLIALVTTAVVENNVYFMPHSQFREICAETGDSEEHPTKGEGKEAGNVLEIGSSQQISDCEKAAGKFMNKNRSEETLIVAGCEATTDGMVSVSGECGNMHRAITKCDFPGRSKQLDSPAGSRQAEQGCAKDDDDSSGPPSFHDDSENLDSEAPIPVTESSKMEKDEAAAEEQAGAASTVGDQHEVEDEGDGFEDAVENQAAIEGIDEKQVAAEEGAAGNCKNSTKPEDSVIKDGGGDGVVDGGVSEA